MNQNETEFGKNLTHRQLLALPHRSEAAPLDRDAGSDWTRRAPCSNPTELLKSTPRGKRE